MNKLMNSAENFQNPFIILSRSKTFRPQHSSFFTVSLPVSESLEIQIHIATWMNLEGVMLRERNQSQKFVLHDYISMTFSKEQNYKDKEQI